MVSLFVVYVTSFITTVLQVNCFRFISPTLKKSKVTTIVVGASHFYCGVQLNINCTEKRRFFYYTGRILKVRSGFLLKLAARLSIVNGLLLALKLLKPKMFLFLGALLHCHIYSYLFYSSMAVYVEAMVVTSLNTHHKVPAFF